MIFPTLHLSNKRKEKKKKRNINNDLAVLPSYDRVFEVVLRPQGKNVVGLKWVYAVKWKEDGGVEKRKARTVAKGFTQVTGEDYEETYALVIGISSSCLCSHSSLKSSSVAGGFFFSFPE